MIFVFVFIYILYFIFLPFPFLCFILLFIYSFIIHELVFTLSFVRFKYCANLDCGLFCHARSVSRRVFGIFLSTLFVHVSFVGPFPRRGIRSWFGLVSQSLSKWEFTMFHLAHIPVNTRASESCSLSLCRVFYFFPHVAARPDMTFFSGSILCFMYCFFGYLAFFVKQHVSFYSLFSFIFGLTV